MDPSLLVKEIAVLVTPYLPQFLRWGESALQKIPEEIIKEKGVELLSKIWPRLKEKPAALETAQEVAVNPKDEDALGAFRFQLKKLLEEDSTLAEEMGSILQNRQRVLAEDEGENEGVKLKMSKENRGTQEVIAKSKGKNKDIEITLE